MIWKYLIENSTWVCKILSSIKSNFYGQLMLSDNEFFFLVFDSAISIRFIKMTFGNSVTDWSVKTVCNSGSWYGGLSESILTSDSLQIYNLFNFKTLKFVSFNSSNGDVIGLRYSLPSWGIIYGAVLIENYFVASVWYSLLIIDVVSFEFKLYKIIMNEKRF